MGENPTSPNKSSQGEHSAVSGKNLLLDAVGAGLNENREMRTMGNSGEVERVEVEEFIRGENLLGAEKLQPACEELSAQFCGGQHAAQFQILEGDRVAMELDGDPLSKSPGSLEGKGNQGNYGVAQVVQMGKRREEEDKGELIQVLAHNSNNKKLRTFKRLKRARQDISKKVEGGLDRKRSYEDGAKENKVIKRQRLEVMWRDGEGDVVEVETDYSLRWRGCHSSSAR